jgi:hypothetical protein
MAFAIHLSLYKVYFNDREGSEIIENLLVANKYFLYLEL